jgi:hypothetical protein
MIHLSSILGRLATFIEGTNRALKRIVVSPEERLKCA